MNTMGLIDRNLPIPMVELEYSMIRLDPRTGSNAGNEGCCILSFINSNEHTTIAPPIHAATLLFFLPINATKHPDSNSHTLEGRR
ncbi:hypothetical protein D3C81_1862410 [compost metagenome]